MRSGAPCSSARAARSSFGKVDDVLVRDEHRADVGHVVAGQCDARFREVLLDDVVDERQHRAVMLVGAQVEQHAVERRQQLVVRHVEAGPANLVRERLGRQMTPVRKEDERPAGGADPRQDVDGAGLEMERRALPVHERAVDVEDEALDVVKSHGATPRPRLLPARVDA